MGTRTTDPDALSVDEISLLRGLLYAMQNLSLSAADIEIGAVELKNASDDTRAVITAAGAVKTDGSAVTQPVSGTFWQTTQPVSGPLTDTQLRATAVPVSGTVTANVGSAAGTRVEGTITAGGTAQAVFGVTPANGYEIINTHATETLYIRESASAATVADNSFNEPIEPGRSYTTPAGYKPGTDVSVIAATTGHAFTARRW